MANSFLSAADFGLIGKEAAYEWKNNNTFLATATRDYDHMYDSNVYYNPGNKIYVRLPNNFLVQEGDVVSAKDVKEAAVDITLQDILSVPLTYTTTDLTTKVGLANWKNRILFPAARNLCAALNDKIAALAATQTNLVTGDAAANVNAYSVVDNAAAVLDEKGAARSVKRYCALAVRQAAALRQSATLQNSFDVVLNREITRNSTLGRLAGFDMFMDQSIYYQDTYSTDARTSVTVKTDIAAGASTMVLTGLTVSKTGIIKAGDPIKFTGIKSVNPITLASTGQDFTVVATADADSDASGDATVTFSPAVIFDTTNARRNVTGQIVATTPVVFTADHHVNMAWAEDGLIIVCPKLAPLDSPFSQTFQDPETGYSLRLSKTAEVLNNKNVMRLDILWGARWLQDRAVRIASL